MILENDSYRVELDERHGLVLSVFDKIGDLELVAEPALADNFRLLLPMPDLHANYILGKEQELTFIEATPDGATLRWDGPLANSRDDFDIRATMRVEFVGQAVQFRMGVENRTQFELAEVWYPLIGGIMGLGSGDEREKTRALVPHRYSQWDQDIFVNFGNAYDLGTPVPERLFTYPSEMSMPWASFYHAGLCRSFYFAVHDTEARAKTLRLAMHPGVAQGRAGGDWPRPDELDGFVSGVSISWTCFPYTKPGETFEGPPVVLQFHEGDWHQACEIYRDWFTAHFPVADSRKSWIRQQTACQVAMFMLPEDNINFTFRDIPRWAEDALRYGVKGVLITGWHCGGHDRGYPRYEPDPRLGTWEELRESIEQCHRMGVRVLLFVNIYPVDVSTDWFRSELHRYISMNHRGVGFGVMGWGMGTLGARMGSTRSLVAGAAPALPEFRSIIVRQMKRLAEVGADGLHIDKVAPPALDFNPLLTTGPDRAPWEGTLQCLEEIAAECRAVNPEFCLTIEGWWDRLLSYTDVVWWAPREPSVLKTVFPQWVPCTGVAQPYDFNVVNRAVLLGHNLLIGPANYTASMSYRPMRRLSAYVKEIIRIRSELLDTLSWGEFLDEAPVQIGGEFASDVDAGWSVFRSIETGRRACVLVNPGGKPLTAVVAAFDGDDSRAVLVYQPFAEDKDETLPVSLTVEPDGLAVIAESV